MKAYLGVTDLQWYQHLWRHSGEFDEVNFWFPSSTQGFRALATGQPFIFKTHVTPKFPRLSNRIVGLGLFSGYARMRVSEAWTLFGGANGVESEDELRSRIERYRRTPIGQFEDPEIGCVLLNGVTLFDEDATLAAPSDFAGNIVRGRVYEVQELSADHSVAETLVRYRLDASVLISEATRGDRRLVTQRLGQRAFKAVVADKYGHHCAITGDKVRPVLQAAHILPVSQGGEHRVDNGLLLRSDVHTLFDRGFIGVDPSYRLRVSPALREQFGNGDWFYERQGRTIDVPKARVDRPNREFLEWHNDEVFLGT